MSYPYIIQGSNLTVVIGNQPHTISSSHPTYQKLKDGIKTGNWDLVKELVEPTKMVLKFGKGHIEVSGVNVPLAYFSVSCGNITL